MCDFFSVSLQNVVYELLAQAGKFTLKNTLSSMRVAKVRNTAYISRQVLPNFRSNLNLLSENAMYSSKSVDSKDIAEYSKPCELMPTQCLPGDIGKNDAFISQGNPKHKRMSNVFDPMLLLMPIDP